MFSLTRIIISLPVSPAIVHFTSVLWTSYLHHVLVLLELIGWFIVFNATFSNISAIMATSFSGGRSRSIGREPPTMDKQLVNFITCGCKSSAPFFCNLQSRAWTHAVLVIGLNWNLYYTLMKILLSYLFFCILKAIVQYFFLF